MTSASFPDLTAVIAKAERRLGKLGTAIVGGVLLVLMLALVAWVVVFTVTVVVAPIWRLTHPHTPGPAVTGTGYVSRRVIIELPPHP